LLLPSVGLTQTLPRLAQRIDETKLFILRGNTRPEAKPANDRGTVADTFLLEHLFLQLRRSVEQEKALEQFIDQLHDPKSPTFHQWITAEQFGQRYGLAQEDLDTITGWLQLHGFTVGGVYLNRMVIDFSGTAAQVREAFHTEVHYLEVKGKRHIGNVSDPQIPAALAPAIAGIVSLNDFRPRAMRHLRARYTDGSGGQEVVPADLYTIYNFNPIFAAGYTGKGQTIVVVEDSDLYSTEDWTTFRTTFGLTPAAYPYGSLTVVHPGNCKDPGVDPSGDDGEAILDAEWASAAAPNAAIEVAACANPTAGFGGFVALQNILNTVGTPPAIVSVSYGDTESHNGATFNASIYSLYQQAVTAGVSVFVSSGDELAAGNDGDADSATHGINVSGWASTPYNVAVGGTDFADTYFDSPLGTYWSSSNTSTDGSAKSYIPEIPWNDSCASTLLLQYNGFTDVNSFCNSDSSQGYTDEIVGGSGGPSACATGSPSIEDVVSGSCAGYPKPSWQAVFGNPNDGVRDLPDVSLFAADGAWGHYYVYCWSNPKDYSNGQGAAPCTGTPDTWAGAGGTSFSSPIMAGIQALINQYTGSRWGNPNPKYYALARTEYGTSGNTSCNSTDNSVGNSCVFYDVTLGDIDAPCTGSYNCYLPSGTYGVLSTSDSKSQPAYPATSGWDFATGIGTVNVANLVLAFSQVTTPPVVVTGAASSVSATTATLNGSVDSYGSATTYYFQYGTSGGSLTNSTVSQSAGSGTTSTSATATLSSLSPNTIYYFRLVANNSAGTVYGTTLGFTTSAGFELVVDVSGTGTGTVNSSTGGINCGSTCSAYYNSGTPVALLAIANPGSTFAGWSGGGCGGTGTCQVTMNTSATVGATFSLVNVPPGLANLPIIFSLSSSGATAGGTGLTLTVQGANFASNSFVLWNGAVRATTYVSSTQLTAIISAADIAYEATNLVTVANLSPTPGVSAATPFGVISSTPVAKTSALSTAIMTGGTGNYVLTLRGTDFVSRSIVQWSGVSVTTNYLSPWTVEATITAAEYAGQPAAITVQNPSGTSAIFELQ
jgi:hypothetical protein